MASPEGVRFTRFRIVSSHIVGSRVKIAAQKPVVAKAFTSGSSVTFNFRVSVGGGGEVVKTGANVCPFVGYVCDGDGQGCRTRFIDEYGEDVSVDSREEVSYADIATERDCSNPARGPAG
jgi:hypothetical protein